MIKETGGYLILKEGNNNGWDPHYKMPFGVLSRSCGGISDGAQRKFHLLWSWVVQSTKTKKENPRKEGFKKKKSFKILYDNHTKKAVRTEIYWSKYFAIVFLEIKL